VIYEKANTSWFVLFNRYTYLVIFCNEGLDQESWTFI